MEPDPGYQGTVQDALLILHKAGVEKETITQRAAILDEQEDPEAGEEDVSGERKNQFFKEDEMRDGEIGVRQEEETDNICGDEIEQRKLGCEVQELFVVGGVEDKRTEGGGEDDEQRKAWELTDHGTLSVATTMKRLLNSELGEDQKNSAGLDIDSDGKLEIRDENENQEVLCHQGKDEGTEIGGGDREEREAWELTDHGTVSVATTMKRLLDSQFDEGQSDSAGSDIHCGDVSEVRNENEEQEGFREQKKDKGTEGGGEDKEQREAWELTNHRTVSVPIRMKHLLISPLKEEQSKSASSDNISGNKLEVRNENEEHDDLCRQRENAGTEGEEEHQEKREAWELTDHGTVSVATTMKHLLDSQLDEDQGESAGSDIDSANEMELRDENQEQEGFCERRDDAETEEGVKDDEQREAWELTDHGTVPVATTMKHLLDSQLDEDHDKSAGSDIDSANEMEVRDENQEQEGFCERGDEAETEDGVKDDEQRGAWELTDHGTVSVANTMKHLLDSQLDEDQGESAGSDIDSANEMELRDEDQEQEGFCERGDDAETEEGVKDDEQREAWELTDQGTVSVATTMKHLLDSQLDEDHDKSAGSDIDSDNEMEVHEVTREQEGLCERGGDAGTAEGGDQEISELEVEQSESAGWAINSCNEMEVHIENKDQEVVSVHDKGRERRDRGAVFVTMMKQLSNSELEEGQNRNENSNIADHSKIDSFQGDEGREVPEDDEKTGEEGGDEEEHEMWELSGRVAVPVTTAAKKLLNLKLEQDESQREHLIMRGENVLEIHDENENQEGPEDVENVEQEGGIDEEEREAREPSVLLTIDKQLLSMSLEQYKGLRACSNIGRDNEIEIQVENEGQVFFLENDENEEEEEGDQEEGDARELDRCGVEPISTTIQELSSSEQDQDKHENENADIVVEQGIKVSEGATCKAASVPLVQQPNRMDARPFVRFNDQTVTISFEPQTPESSSECHPESISERSTLSSLSSHDFNESDESSKHKRESFLNYFGSSLWSDSDSDMLASNVASNRPSALEPCAQSTSTSNSLPAPTLPILMNLDDNDSEAIDIGVQSNEKEMMAAVEPHVARNSLACETEDTSELCAIGISMCSNNSSMSPSISMGDWTSQAYSVGGVSSIDLDQQALRTQTFAMNDEDDDDSTCGDNSTDGTASPRLFEVFDRCWSSIGESRDSGGCSGSDGTPASSKGTPPSACIRRILSAPVTAMHKTDDSVTTQMKNPEFPLMPRVNTYSGNVNSPCSGSTRTFMANPSRTYGTKKGVRYLMASLPMLPDVNECDEDDQNKNPIVPLQLSRGLSAGQDGVPVPYTCSNLSESSFEFELLNRNFTSRRPDRVDRLVSAPQRKGSVVTADKKLVFQEEDDIKMMSVVRNEFSGPRPGSSVITADQKLVRDEKGHAIMASVVREEVPASDASSVADGPWNDANMLPCDSRFLFLCAACAIHADPLAYGATLKQFRWAHWTGQERCSTSESCLEFTPELPSESRFTHISEPELFPRDWAYGWDKAGELPCNTHLVW